jgi:hypothetical protein
VRCGEAVRAGHYKDVHAGLEHGLDRWAITLRQTLRLAVLDDDRMPQYVAGFAQTLEDDPRRMGTTGDKSHPWHARLSERAARAQDSARSETDEDSATVEQRGCVRQIAPPYACIKPTPDRRRIYRVDNFVRPSALASLVG